MTRGRKKDLTIPPTRALTQQRDYRARKAQYLADLEERCRKAEQENAELKKEIEALKIQTGISTIGLQLTPEMVQATRQLMEHVAATQASLGHFQRLLMGQPDALHSQMASTSTSPPPNAVPSASAVALPSAAFQLPLTPPAVSPQTLAREVLSSLPHLDIPPAAMSANGLPEHSGRGVEDCGNSVTASSRSESPMSECCGGLMDCTGLVESEDEAAAPRGGCKQKTSELRSTSGGSDRYGEGSSGIPRLG
ncbi:hypothetical protein GLOTRDRAFT_115395 [Gloeophyllum trabeum ATCC 11539]|uniref:BZIP domain-containing protein n=1 Tax=Gloeophyllum trabeum (strain ATCC 11539 / FP-39264 / Madison 617) TaxID=670483 RepID=S7QDQ9_GLOTA|nr:uncharacterized protein GLOTRDRAFT_115395 [Gloeophyllum trabeum ATCC 11539]EPQ57467.1 hypothetical protein GLOTRDRAFT_115395 [Gloeophyllum trabeum ATCC 11539]